MNYLVPLSRPDIKEEEVVDDINLAENMVSSDTLKGAEKTLLEAKKQLYCVLPCNFENFVAQIGSDERLELENSVSLNLADSTYQTWSSQHLDKSENEYLSKE